MEDRTEPLLQYAIYIISLCTVLACTIRYYTFWCTALATQRACMPKVFSCIRDGIPIVCSLFVSIYVCVWVLGTQRYMVVNTKTTMATDSARPNPLFLCLNFRNSPLVCGQEQT